MTSDAVLAEFDLDTLPGPAAMRSLLDAAADGAKAQGKSLAVLALDVDHFKRFTDQIDPARAEEPLARLAGLLAAALPANAQLARLGGDEFVISLPAAELPAAAALAEELRASVVEHFGSDELTPGLTITIGAAASPKGGDWSARSLLALADTRMTFAKKRLLPHHNLVWAGSLPSDWYQRLGIAPGLWPSL